MNWSKDTTGWGTTGYRAKGKLGTWTAKKTGSRFRDWVLQLDGETLARTSTLRVAKEVAEDREEKGELRPGDLMRVRRS